MSLDELFEVFLREKKYLQNVSEWTTDFYKGRSHAGSEDKSRIACASVAATRRLRSQALYESDVTIPGVPIDHEAGHSIRAAAEKLNRSQIPVR